jgi:predicted dehydrogenase
MNTRTRVAILGCGAVAELAAEWAYPRLRDVAEVVAVVDPRPERAERLAAAVGARAFPSLDAALAAERIDAVDVRLPNHLHLSGALGAIASGAHVLVEKPLATRTADAERIIRAAADAGVVLAVGENYSFFAPVARARSLVADGAVGDVVMVRSTRVFRIGGIWVRDGWRLDPGRAGGGVIIDQGCHQANLLRRLVGEFTHVHAFAVGRQVSPSEDAVVVNCRFENGVIGQQLYGWSCPTPEQGPDATVYGTEGSIEIHTTYGVAGGGTLLKRSDQPGGQRWESRDGDYFETFHASIADWLHACRDGRPPVVPGEEGLADLRVALALYESLDTGDTVAVAAASAAHQLG